MDIAECSHWHLHILVELSMSILLHGQARTSDVVRSAAERVCARMTQWVLMPVSSRLEMVMLPFGLKVVKRDSLVRGVNLWRHSYDGR